MTSTIKKQFRISGATVHPFTHTVGSVVDQVPAGLYVIQESMFGYYLEKKADQIALPEKIYGSTMSRADRIMDTFNRKPAAMAVGLFGNKGAGKTLLANVLANRAINEGRAVIDVSHNFSTSAAYIEFINSLGNTVVIFDEFLKHLSKLGPETSEDSDRNKRNNARDRQDELLTFFQGTDNSKRLVILIDNNHSMLSEFLLDRPGRMRYYFTYTGVETAVVEALAKDAALTEEQTESLCTYSRRYKVTFDVINEIIDEWKHHPDETLEELVEIMNVPNIYGKATYKAQVMTFDQSKDGVQYALTNELIEISSDGGFSLQLTYPNPFFNHPEVSREEWEKTDFYNYDDFGYGTFIKYRLDPQIPTSCGFNDNCLIGIKNGMAAYENRGITITVKELTDKAFNASHTLNYF